MSGRSSVLRGAETKRSATVGGCQRRASIDREELRKAGPCSSRGAEARAGESVRGQRSRCELTDQSDDRELRIEIVTPEAHLREDSEKCAHDDVEFLACQLIERQPLAEDSTRRETARRGLVHLSRVQVSSPRIPGDEQVGHNHIETVRLAAR